MKKKRGRESRAHEVVEQRERRGIMSWGLKKKEGKGIQGVCGVGAWN